MAPSLRKMVTPNGKLPSALTARSACVSRLKSSIVTDLPDSRNFDHRNGVEIETSFAVVQNKERIDALVR